MSTNSTHNDFSNYAARPKPIISFGRLIKAGSVIFIIGVTSPFWFAIVGSVTSMISGAPECTADRLVEQARGDKYYWDVNGKPWSSWRALQTRHPKRLAREAAIKELGDFKPLPEDARNGLISLLVDGKGDFDSGDGVYGSRSTICYTLGRSADHWSAYEAMFKVLRDRALNPELDKENHVKWFDKSWGHYGATHTGPAAIVRGFRFTPPEQHKAIIARLEALLAELKSAPVSSDWAISEIQDGIKAFKDYPQVDEWEMGRYCNSDW